MVFLSRMIIGIVVTLLVTESYAGVTTLFDYIDLSLPFKYAIEHQRQKSAFKKHLKELRKMSDTPIMDYGDFDIMFPSSVYGPGDQIDNIFAVPNDNMIGTNDLDNAITLLEFKTNEELGRHIVKKDFMEEVTGAYEFRYLPVWSDKEIAYSQSKGFLLVNIPDKKVEIHTISRGIYTGDIETIEILNPAQRLFVLEINPHAEEGYEKILKVIRFDNKTFTILAERSAGIRKNAYTEPWFVYQGKIFLYNDSTTKLEVYDETFTVSSHPLADAFNTNSVGFRCMQEIAIHPTLPIALIIEQGKWPTEKQLTPLDSLPTTAKEKAWNTIFDEARRVSLFLFRWNEPDAKKQFTPILSAAGSLWNTYNPVDYYSHFSFSPDGKWVVFRDGSMRGYDEKSSQNPIFVAVPIREKNPLYLGKPIKLGNAMREDATGPTGTAWSTNPTAFVMCDGMAIYRWNLDKYTSASTQKVKMPPNAPDPFIKKDD